MQAVAAAADNAHTAMRMCTAKGKVLAFGAGACGQTAVVEKEMRWYPGS